MVVVPRRLHILTEAERGKKYTNFKKQQQQQSW